MQKKWASLEAADTEAQLAELCGGSDSESEEEEVESSEPLQESDIELSQSGESQHGRQVYLPPCLSLL